MKVADVSPELDELRRFLDRHDELVDRVNKFDQDLHRFMSRVIKERTCLLGAVQAAYRKHHKGDESIGWNELSDILYQALAEVMGDDAFVEWNENQPKP